jgi:L-ascorbate metabolism protein UlaG (beta-lactamase superfamily)
MEITKYKHTTYQVKAAGKSILIDPGIFTFGEGLLRKDYFDNIDILLLSHRHADHFDMEAVKNMYKRCRPKILSQKDVANELNSEGIESSILESGQSVNLDGITISATRTAHKQACIGFLINDGETGLYYVADSFYIEDKPEADILIVPIENRGIMMGPAEAAKFTKEIKPRIAIPSHYETPKSIVKPEEFVKEMENSGIEVKILGFEESVRLR